MVKKFHMRRLDLNTINLFSVIFEFSILRVKIAKFLKIWIFKHNSALNYSTVKKFHMKELDMNTKKKPHLTILEFFNLTGKIDKSRKIWIFERNPIPDITSM